MGRNGHAAYPSIEPAARNDRVLIVAPHMDDEAIGAGAYALDALAAGADVFIAFLTAGDCARFSARLLHRKVTPSPSDYLAVGRTRIAEAEQAARILGLEREHVFVLGYPDRGLRPILEDASAIVQSASTHATAVPYEAALSPGAPHRLDSIVTDLQRIFEMTRPTTVITPVWFDTHPDHSSAAEIVDLALDDSPFAPHRLGYLVHSTEFKSLIWRPERALLPPPRLRSFTWATYPVTQRAQDVKAAMLEAYRSQRPYTYLLRNSFIRSNELFFAYTTRKLGTARDATPFACEPLSSASSL